MRRQLLVLVAATTSLVLVAFLVPLALLLRADAEDRAVALATLEAQAIAPVVGTFGVDGIQAALDQLNAGGDFEVSLFLPGGVVLGTPARRTAGVELATSGRAFSTDLPDSAGGGRAVLVPVQGLSGGTAVIQAVVPNRVLHRGVTRAWGLIGLLGLALLVLAVVLADQLGRRLVQSVGQVAAVSDQLAAGDLNARVTPQGPPEIRKVGAGLNRLANRIGELLTAEREEVADLSHRLRTPVTALRLDADSLHDPEESARLVADVDDLARMVDEVIRSARRPVREGVGASGDLAEVAGQRAAFWSVLAEDQGRELTTSVPATPLRVRVSRDDLVAVVDALLGNVFAHTPEGAGLRITVTPRAGGGGLLVVDDGGRGFRGGDALLERGRSDGGSTGLGLDIVRRTAEASGGGVKLGRSDEGGARVSATFGPPA